VRRHNKTSFSRVFDAGHTFGAFQPETVSNILDRVTFDVIVATGDIHTNGSASYSSTGPTSSFGVEIFCQRVRRTSGIFGMRHVRVQMRSFWLWQMGWPSEGFQPVFDVVWVLSARWWTFIKQDGDTFAFQLHNRAAFLAIAELLSACLCINNYHRRSLSLHQPRSFRYKRTTMDLRSG
jgi:hypothetical protein